MKKLLVKPAPNRLVRDPATGRPLPAEGAEVEGSSYWLRRLSDGDVVDASTEKKPAARKPAAKTGGEE